MSKNRERTSSTQRLSSEHADKAVYPHSHLQLAHHIKEGSIAQEDLDLMSKLRSVNWKETHWDLTDATHRADAAHALSLGIPVFHPFGNFIALTFHPHIESMRTVNVAKGREQDQVASIVTTKEYISEIFDWSKLPEGISASKAMELIDVFYDADKSEYAGPFGFRGPAAAHIPDHLTSVDKQTGIRTVQIIMPGYQCESNELLTTAIKKLDKHKEKVHYLAITSANISSRQTGHDEPAHYRTDGIREDFGEREPGFVIVGHPNEQGIRAKYPHHEPNSTAIIDLSRGHVSENGNVSMYLARHGSLPDEKVRHVASKVGIGVLIDDTARKSLPLRHYPQKHTT